MSAELRVDPMACEAHGLCAELLPERIVLDEWGYPIIDRRPVPEHLLAHARRAASACPTLALKLQRVGGTPDRTNDPDGTSARRRAA